MLIFVRHGATHSNEIGNEKLRGWLPIPLSMEGMEDMRTTADCLTALEHVDCLKCATLVRVIQSATIISEALQCEIEPMEELNDWNTGDFAGEPVKETLDDLHSHIREPLKKVPGGEPFQFFLDRILPVLTDLIESDKINIAISSGRVSTLLKASQASKGKEPDTAILLGKPPIDPGGVLIIDHNWKITFATKKSEESKGLS